MKDPISWIGSLFFSETDFEEEARIREMNERRRREEEKEREQKKERGP